MACDCVPPSPSLQTQSSSVAAKHHQIRPEPEGDANDVEVVMVDSLLPKMLNTNPAQRYSAKEAKTMMQEARCQQRRSGPSAGLRRVRGGVASEAAVAARLYSPRRVRRLRMYRRQEAAALRRDPQGPHPRPCCSGCMENNCLKSSAICIAHS